MIPKSIPAKIHYEIKNQVDLLKHELGLSKITTKSLQRQLRKIILINRILWGVISLGIVVGAIYALLVVLNYL